MKPSINFKDTLSENGINNDILHLGLSIDGRKGIKNLPNIKELYHYLATEFFEEELRISAILMEYIGSKSKEQADDKAGAIYGSYHAACLMGTTDRFPGNDRKEYFYFNLVETMGEEMLVKMFKKGGIQLLENSNMGLAGKSSPSQLGPLCQALIIAHIKKSKNTTIAYHLDGIREETLNEIKGGKLKYQEASCTEAELIFIYANWGKEVDGAKINSETIKFYKQGKLIKSPFEKNTKKNDPFSPKQDLSSIKIFLLSKLEKRNVVFNADDYSCLTDDGNESDEDDSNAVVLTLSNGNDDINIGTPLQDLSIFSPNNLNTTTPSYDYNDDTPVLLNLPS